MTLKNVRNATTGIHPVQCILQHKIPSEFAEDDSFKEEFNEPLTKSAFLTIMQTGEILYPWYVLFMVIYSFPLGMSLVM